MNFNLSATPVGCRHFSRWPAGVLLLAWGVLCVLVCQGAGAEKLPAVVRYSRQFTVLDVRPISATSPGPLRSDSGHGLIPLYADVLLLSAERIKDALFRELAFNSEGSKIRLSLYLAATPVDVIGVISAFSPDGWSYDVRVPDQVDVEKLVRGIVTSLLLEIANRGQGPKCADLPLWLVEGLTFHILSIGGDDLAVSAVPLGSMLRVVRERRGLDYLDSARTVMRSAPLLGFSELAYPKAETLAGKQLKIYQRSSQLFVYELLHTQQGQSKMLALLRLLPHCWNWETALLHAFSGEFQRMLDVEKAWSVTAVAFTSQEPSRVWSKAVAMERLTTILAVPAQIRVTADVLPQRKILTLQQVIANWDFASQTPVLQQKVSLLAGLRLGSSPDVLPLIDGYQRTLLLYLQRRTAANYEPETRMKPAPNAALVVKDALRDLNALDKRRKELDPRESLTVNSTINH